MNKNLIQNSKKIIKQAEDMGIKKFYALVSGGKDSVTLAHLVSNHIRKIDGVIFIDTSIGCRKDGKLETKEFVKSFCKKNKFELKILKPRLKDNFENTTKRYGFCQHKIYFYNLKWKPLREFVQKKGEDIGLLSGVRRLESKRRFRTVKTPIERDASAKKMVWIAPLIDWTTMEVFDYIRENNLEISPCSKLLHLSGDCFCGAYAKIGEAELISMFYPENAEEIKKIEYQVKDMKYYKWGNKNMSKAMQTKPLMSFLCNNCHKY